MASTAGHVTAGDYYGLPLDWLRTELESWKAAHTALSTSASYEIASGQDSRRLTRTELPMVRDTIRAIASEVRRQEAEAEGISTSRSTRANFSAFFG